MFKYVFFSFIIFKLIFLSNSYASIVFVTYSKCSYTEIDTEILVGKE